MLLKKNQSIIVALLLVLISLPWLSLFNSNFLIGTLDPDSDQYLQFAGTIARRSLPLVTPDAYTLSGEIIRTPGYPLFLTAAIYLEKLGLPLGQSILICSSLLWVLVLLSALYYFRKSVSVPKTLIAFSLGCIVSAPFIKIIVTEWTVFVGLCAYFTALTSVFKRGSYLNTGVLGLLTAALALVRPDYLLLLPLSVFVVFLSGRKRPHYFMSLLMGITPLLVWLNIQSMIIGRYTLAPVEGYIYAAISPMGPGEFADADVDLSNFAAAMKGKLQALDITDLLTIPFLAPESSMEKVIGNLQQAENFRANNEIPWLEFNETLFRYSKNVLLENLPAYFLFLLFGLATLIWCVPLIYILSKVSKSYSDRPRSAIYKAAACTLLVHIAHVTLVCMTNIIHTRYYFPTFAVALVFVLMAKFETDKDGG